MSNEGATKKHRIFLVDDHPLVRESLANLINQQPDMEICGDAEDAESARQGLETAQPHLVVVDISLKSISGLDLIREIRQTFPSILTMVLSMHEESMYAERAFRAGAKGYLIKRETSKAIVEALRKVLAGGLYLSERVALAVAEQLIRSTDSAATPIADQLSSRELEIFGLLGQGITTAHIAENLKLSLKTVQSYCGRIKEKLHLSNSVELLREAVCWYENQRKN
jgi:DNA-binding NarL/FixJ family response regulator